MQRGLKGETCFSAGPAQALLSQCKEDWKSSSSLSFSFCFSSSSQCKEDWKINRRNTRVCNSRRCLNAKRIESITTDILNFTFGISLNAKRIESCVETCFCCAFSSCLNAKRIERIKCLLHMSKWMMMVSMQRGLKAVVVSVKSPVPRPSQCKEDWKFEWEGAEKHP